MQCSALHSCSVQNSDSGSSSSSSSSSGSSARRRKREKHKRKRKEEKRLKKERKHLQMEKKKKHKKRKAEHRPREERSIITGKRIQRADGATADAEGEARRVALRQAMNEGEDEGCAGASAGATSKRPSIAQQARSDPALMAELMMASAAASRAKKQRLGALKRGGGEDYAGAIGREYLEHRGTGGGRRTAYDAADYMKPDTGF